MASPNGHQQVGIVGLPEIPGLFEKLLITAPPNGVGQAAGGILLFQKLIGQIIPIPPGRIDVQDVIPNGQLHGLHLVQHAAPVILHHLLIGVILEQLFPVLVASLDGHVDGIGHIGTVLMPERRNQYFLAVHVASSPTKMRR